MALDLPLGPLFDRGGRPGAGEGPRAREGPRTRKRHLDPQDVPLRELFPPRFMSAHTSFASIGDMLRALAADDPAREAWRAAFHTPEWEEHVRRTTGFESWSAMRAAAAAQLKRRRR